MTIRVCEAMNAPVGRLSDRTVCEANGGVLPRQVLIDADGCPVVDLTLQIAKRFGVPVIILCDTSHQIEREGAQTLVFDKGADSVDFALVEPGKTEGCGRNTGLRAGQHVSCQVRPGAEPEWSGVHR